MASSHCGGEERRGRVAADALYTKWRDTAKRFVIDLMPVGAQIGKRQRVEPGPAKPARARTGKRAWNVSPASSRSRCKINFLRLLEALVELPVH
jgi:hypothetical protein